MAQVAAWATLLTACAGPSAGGQTPPADPGSLGRVYLYEVPNDDPRLLALQEGAGAGWIEVNGWASVQVSPDRARVTFAVETRAEAADDAASTNADAMAEVLSALRSAGLDGLELETFGYSLQPEYAIADPQRARTREIVAYTVVNNVGATLTDVDAVGRVIDVAIDAGANRVGGISFFASNTDAPRREAVGEAVRNARAEAETIAESLGYSLGPPLEVNGGADRPVPITHASGIVQMSRAAETPIETGDQTVTARVTVRFALGPELGG